MGMETNMKTDTTDATTLAVRIVEQSHMHHLRKTAWGSDDFKDWIEAALEAEFYRGFQEGRL